MHVYSTIRLTVLYVCPALHRLTFMPLGRLLTDYYYAYHRAGRGCSPTSSLCGGLVSFSSLCFPLHLRHSRIHVERIVASLGCLLIR